MNYSVADLFGGPTVSAVARHFESRSLSGSVADILMPPFMESDQRRVSVVGEEYPMSSVQMRMYFLQQLDIQSSAYNMTGTWEITGPLDIRRLENAFKAVIRRHEILRICYTDRMTQVVSDDVSFSVRVCGVATSRDDPVLVEELKRIGNEPFLLDGSDTLIRCTIVSGSLNTNYLLVSMHHIAGDRMSFNPLWDDLAMAYSTGESLPPLQHQYIDYCLWEKRYILSDAYTSQLGFWRDKLGMNPAVLDIPLDYPRSHGRDGTGATASIRIPDFKMLVKELLHRSNTTVFMLLASVYSVLLHRYATISEMIIGILSSGRTWSETDPMIGMFVNTLPLKVVIENGMSFSALCDKVKHEVLQAFSNQNVPFEHIVKEVVTEHSLDSMPLCQTMFTFDDDSQSTELSPLADCASAPISVDLPIESSKFDISLGTTLCSDGSLYVEC